MKVLISAYACEPNRGSEPGIGWHWALEIARLGHEVWVLTRANNRASIEAEHSALSIIPNLHFLYYDLPLWASWWKKGPRGVRTYNVLWQWGAYRMVRAEHRRLNFDRVHHVTLGSIRQPSFMGSLGTEFIFGPLGGGERTPWRLRWGYGWRGWTLDGSRDGLNWLARFDPFMRRTFAQAEAIYTTSCESRAVIPGRWRQKARIQLAVGLEQPALRRPVNPASRGDQFRLLFIGRLLFWKGGWLGIRALAEASRRGCGAQLTIVGDGSDRARWQALADKVGARDLITWKPWVAQYKIAESYRSHDVLLFPSLHDSGGLVVLEAMSHGLPVVCLDLGGPGAMVDSSCGSVVATTAQTEAQVVDGLATAIVSLRADEALFARLSEGARRRAAVFSWERQVRAVYEPATVRAAS